MGNEQGKIIDTTTPEGVKAMDENLQKKFAKGIQYNMKIVVRGDRNTGKSCLLYRMQGKTFSESYIPTNEIQIAHILWTYPGTNDTVKVEIWDTVDKGKAHKANKGLKLFNSKDHQEPSEGAVLDAEFLDVYKGAHAVVFIYDIVKLWTWQYIERQLPLVPLHIPIVVLGNFSDMKEHRSKQYEDAEFYVTHLNRPDGAADIRYAECSMKNGFGLHYLHKFLSIPFLQMQQESLLYQLKTNREQILVIQEELDGFQTSSSYDEFHQKKVATSGHPSATPPSLEQPHPSKPSGSSPVINRSEEFESTDGSTPPETRSNKFASKLSGFLSRNKESPPIVQPVPSKPETTPKGQPKSKMGDVDDFVPEGDLDDQFFADSVNDEDSSSREGDGVSDDGDDQNPQVAIDEDLSSEEDETTQLPLEGHTPSTVQESDSYIDPPTSSKPIKETIQLKSVHDIVLTESEEEEESDEEVKEHTEIVKLENKESNKKKQPIASGKGGNGGLLLAFKETPPQKKKSKKKKMDKDDSLDQTKKTHHSSDHQHTKKHKKKSKADKEVEEVSSKVQEDLDPFGFTTSLDTWLGGSGEESSPIQPRSTIGLSKKLSESLDDDPVEEKSKKHSKTGSKKRRKSKKDSMTT